jgi:hypothetical protein
VLLVEEDHDLACAHLAQGRSQGLSLVGDDPALLPRGFGDGGPAQQGGDLAGPPAAQVLVLAAD